MKRISRSLPLFRRERESGGEGHRGDGGQALVLLAIAFIALLAFVGLVTDAGMLYLTYGQLKRAVDAAAVAAAGDFKRGENLDRLREAAREMTAFHNVDPTTLDLDVFICDANSDNVRDDPDSDGAPPWDGLPPNFWSQCPDTAAGEAPRKLVWVDTTQHAPVYFLQLVGVQAVNLSTNAISEAATVDVVIVLDVSESMGSDRCDQQPAGDVDPPCTADYTNPNDFDPTTCNTANACYPLREAKNAAKALVSTLYDGYDQVAIVTFDYYAVAQPILNPITGTPEDLSLNLGDDDGVADGDAYAAIDAIQLHDDAPSYKFSNPAGRRWWPKEQINPVNPEDRDGDGYDADPALPCTDNNDDHFDDADGSPCDQDGVMDAYDWDNDGCPHPDPGICPGGDPDPVNPNPDMDDNTLGQAYVTRWGHPAASMSSCLGCGMRTAATILRQNGRPNGVWVIVFLSDGLPNMSDLPAIGGCLAHLQAGGTCVQNTRGGFYYTPDIDAGFTNGFCGGQIGVSVFWSDLCVDYTPNNPRYCIDAADLAAVPNPPDDPAVVDTCPPGTTIITTSPNYGVEDYARDMTDEAGLLASTSAHEPSGNDTAIYSIALGQASTENAALVLRYMANVGDDGDRTTAPCPYAPPYTSNCGQYYYAPTGSALTPIFEDIASRIFTRLTQ